MKKELKRLLAILTTAPTILSGCSNITIEDYKYDVSDSSKTSMTQETPRTTQTIGTLETTKPRETTKTIIKETTNATQVTKKTESPKTTTVLSTTTHTTTTVEQPKEKERKKLNWTLDEESPWVKNILEYKRVLEEYDLNEIKTFYSLEQITGLTKEEIIKYNQNKSAIVNGILQANQSVIIPTIYEYYNVLSNNVDIDTLAFNMSVEASDILKYNDSDIKNKKKLLMGKYVENKQYQNSKGYNIYIIDNKIRIDATSLVIASSYMGSNTNIVALINTMGEAGTNQVYYIKTDGNSNVVSVENICKNASSIALYESELPIIYKRSTDEIINILVSCGITNYKEAYSYFETRYDEYYAESEIYEDELGEFLTFDNSKIIKNQKTK